MAAAPDSHSPELPSVASKKRHFDIDSDAVPSAKKLKKGEKYYDPRPTASQLCKPLGGPEFYVENGLKKVRPYWFQFAASTKQRWIGRPVVDVFEFEIYKRTKSFFKDQIKLGRMKINNKETNDNYLLKSNDIITNVIHRHELPTLDRKIKIIVNNDDVVVVDKPCSLPIHPCGRYYYGTLTYTLKHEYGLNVLKLLHRLDRLTSGLVIIAKNAETDLKLKSDMVNHRLKKEYIARVVGEFPSEPVVCQQPIGVLVPSMGIQCANSKEPKESMTSFERMFFDGTSSVVRCFPKTGRTHQIRVHLQYLGHPIVNDTIYNNFAWGQSKGKTCEYGKSMEELIVDVKKAFDSNRRFVDFDDSMESYEEFRKQFVDADNNLLQNMVNGAKKDDDNYYDPLCPDCHLKPVDPELDELEMYLHCVKYEMNSTQRQAKDLAADCYNLWTKWQDLHHKSLATIENIANRRILLLDPEASSKVDVDFDADRVRYELTNFCEQLKTNFTDEFERIARKFDKIRENFDALNTLTSLETNENELLFSSWTSNRFLTAITNISEQLKAELKCKLACFETISLADTREVVEVCISSWTHQPYLDENEIQLLITAIATEAGLL